LAKGGFRAVIGEVEAIDASAVERLVLCSGKVYYDIVETRREKGIDGIAVARIEQLNPYPADAVAAELSRYPHLREVVWAQEEPENQGAWYFVRDRLTAALTSRQTLLYAGRPIMAAPSGGDYHRHLERQKQLVDKALNLPDEFAPTTAVAAGK
jgi:2-oxoglutarate dehydrogenase E1 component